MSRIYGNTYAKVEIISNHNSNFLLYTFLSKFHSVKLSVRKYNSHLAIFFLNPFITANCIGKIWHSFKFSNKFENNDFILLLFELNNKNSSKCES